MNELWPLWITASLNSHAESALTNKIDFYFEGADRDTAKLSSWAEIRVDGPSFTKNGSKNEYDITMEINILVSTRMGTGSQSYAPYVNSGKACLIFTDDIPIYKLGQNQDGTHLGCLTLTKGRREKIAVSNFGIIDPQVKIFQSSIEAHYTQHINSQEWQ